MNISESRVTEMQRELALVWRRCGMNRPRVQGWEAGGEGQLCFDALLVWHRCARVGGGDGGSGGEVCLSCACHEQLQKRQYQRDAA